MVINIRRFCVVRRCVCAVKTPQIRNEIAAVVLFRSLWLTPCFFSFSFTMSSPLNFTINEPSINLPQTASCLRQNFLMFFPSSIEVNLQFQSNYTSTFQSLVPSSIRFSGKYKVQEFGWHQTSVRKAYFLQVGKITPLKIDKGIVIWVGLRVSKLKSKSSPLAFE